MSTVERDGAVGVPEQGFMSVAERRAMVMDDAETVQLRTITVPEAFVHRTDPARSEPDARGPDGPGDGAEGASGAEAPAAARPRGVRDRYLDLLRALALVRVVIYHNFGWTWLPLLFPSMG